MQLGAEHCLVQPSEHCSPRTSLQLLQESPLHCLSQKLLAPSLQRLQSLSVVQRSALQNDDIKSALQSLQEASMSLQVPLHSP